MDPLNLAIAEAVRAESKRARIPLADLHRQTGISETTLKRRLTGNSGFTLPELIVIARTLGVSVRDLIPADA